MFSADQKADLDLVLTAVRAIRERLSVEVAQEGIDDIVEEPPCGSQVTDGSGDIWERREVGWALWWPERSGWVHELLGGDPSPWPTVRSVAPLRPTTDADRERVGLKVEPAPADVDPDEDDDAEFSAASLHYARATKAEAERDWWRDAARRHVEERSALEANRDALKADLARVTEERDNWRASSRDSKQAAKRAES